MTINNYNNSLMTKQTQILIKNILFFIFSISASMSMKAQMKLIPTPQFIEIKNSEFPITNDTKIVRHQVDSFYANQVESTIARELNLQLKEYKKSKSNVIEFIKLTASNDLQAFLVKNKLNEDYKLGEEGYILNISPKSIQIIAPTDAGIFYGIQTLNQIIKANCNENRIPCLVIYDKPDMLVRAWQDDISRGPIPTMEILKKQIREMASYKLNHFSLYIEHVFQLEKHPEIAPKDGITKAQIAELSAYAKKYHVNLIGSYQSFGHMEKTLSIPKFQHLAESDHIISPALDESYEFLDDVYSEIVPVFDGDYFNINCDETHGLGEGNSKVMMDTMGIEGIYVYHINKLDKILKKYDKKIVMWGDIIGSYPDAVKELPKDMTVVVWGYHDSESFDYAITPISNSGLNFWVAPGVNCWSNVFPNFEVAKINIYNMIRDGIKYKATGVLNTTWDDDGLNFFNNNWHGLIWGAENSWKTPSFSSTIEQSKLELQERYHTFNAAYDPLFFGLKDATLTSDMISFSNLHQSGVRDLLQNTRFFEPIFPIHLEYISEGKRMENINALKHLDSLRQRIEIASKKVTDNSLTLDYLKFAMSQVQFTLNKNIFRINLYDFINGQNQITEVAIKNQNSELINQLNQLKTDYAILWNKENRPYWLEKNMLKFDGLLTDLTNLEGYCIITPSDKLTDNGREISIKSLFNDLPLRYTINTDSIDVSATLYTKPFYVTQDVDIKAQAIADGKRYQPTETRLIYHKAIGKLFKLNSNYSTYHPSYEAGGKNALLDGRIGNSDHLTSGFWQGFMGQDIDVEIDLQTVQPIKSFDMGFFQNTSLWVIFPKSIDILVKNNPNDDYQLIKTITNTISPKESGSLKHNFSITFDNTKARFVKVTAHYYGKLPEWHPAGPSYESMLFADEIILK